MKKNQDMLVYVLSGLILVSGVGGYALGAQSEQSSGAATSLEEAGYDALQSKAVTQLTAEVRGDFAGTEGNTIKVEREGETFGLDLGGADRMITLSVISELTEEDRVEIEQFQKDLAIYEADLAKIDMTSATSATEYPVPPTLSFAYNSTPTADPGTEGSVVETKTVSQEIGLADLQSGDVIQATLSNSDTAGMPGTQSSDTAQSGLYINFISAIRDLSR